MHTDKSSVANTSPGARRSISTNFSFNLLAKLLYSCMKWHVASNELKQFRPELLVHSLYCSRQLDGELPKTVASADMTVLWLCSDWLQRQELTICPHMPSPAKPGCASVHSGGKLTHHMHIYHSVFRKNDPNRLCKECQIICVLQNKRIMSCLNW